MSKTSVKIVELESVKQLSTTPLNSLKQGQTWQRPGIETRYVKELWIPKNIFFAYFFVIWTIQHCTNLWWNHRNSIILQNFHCFRFSAVHQLHYWDQIKKKNFLKRLLGDILWTVYVPQFHPELGETHHHELPPTIRQIVQRVVFRHSITFSFLSDSDNLIGRRGINQSEFIVCWNVWKQALYSLSIHHLVRIVKII